VPVGHPPGAKRCCFPGTTGEDMRTGVVANPLRFALCASQGNRRLRCPIDESLTLHLPSMNTRLIAVAITILTAACASSSFPTDPVVYSQSEAADSIRIRVGQTVVVGDIRVRFTAVEQDSRCPSTAICIWQGDATAIMVVERNCDCDSPAFELKLHTTLEPKSGTAYGSRVELLQLSPYPNGTSPIKQDAYSAWIRITRE
jgi:hypothetical protein